MMAEAQDGFVPNAKSASLCLATEEVLLTTLETGFGLVKGETKRRANDVGSLLLCQGKKLRGELKWRTTCNG